MSVEKKHFVDINLQGNKLVNPTLGANADLTKAGSFGFSNGRVKYYDGTTAQDVANLNDLETLHTTITGEITAGFVSALKFQGAYDPTTGTLEAPVAGSVVAGSVYVVSVADTFFTEAVTIGDTLIAKVDDPATLADWIIVQSNLDLATTTTVGSVRMADATDIENAVSGAVAVTPAQLENVRSSAQNDNNFVNNKINTEITNRIADVNAEETRALAAEATLTSNLNDEITRATAAEAALQAAIDQEILDRAADVDAEETRALAAEAALQAEIDALETLSGTGLADEIARATAAEAALQAAIDQEILDRISDITALSNDLTIEVANREADVNAEETRALAAEAALQTAINTEATTRAAAIAQEVADREATIAQEVTDRNAAIAAEKTTVTVLTADWTLVSGVYEVEITHGLSASMVMFSFIAAGVGVEFGYEQLTSTTAKIYSNVAPPASMTVLAHKIA